MADAVATQTIQDGAQHAIFRFTNVSDGTGESAVTKIDVSGLTTNPVTGMSCSSVSIDWADEFDFSDFSGIPDNAGTGATGDVKFTTVGHSSGDVYTIVMTVIKHYTNPS